MSLIEVKGLTKSFGSLQVLKGIDLTVEQNERIAIIGGSGCGKSVFLRSLCLLETPDAVENLDEALMVPGIDQMHIGLNDLHLGYHKRFMFELLADGTVERLCRRIGEAGIPYGFGGVGRPGSGMLRAEAILGEHVRLKSRFVILSRSFCNTAAISDRAQIEEAFQNGVQDIRSVERACLSWTDEQFERNRQSVVESVNRIVEA